MIYIGNPLATIWLQLDFLEFSIVLLGIGAGLLACVAARENLGNFAVFTFAPLYPPISRVLTILKDINFFAITISPISLALSRFGDPRRRRRWRCRSPRKSTWWVPHVTDKPLVPVRNGHISLIPLGQFGGICPVPGRCGQLHVPSSRVACR
jgi:hypothetical protein